MSQWLTEHDLPYRDSQEKAYSTDANIWGATHEAKTLEHLDVSLETVEPIMGVKFWDPARRDRHRGRHGPLRAGPPGRDQRHRRTTTRSRWSTRPTRSAAGTASACPTRSRTGSSRPSRAASTRRPAWRCSGSPTSGCSTRSTTRTPSPTTTREGRRLGRLLYEGRWLDPQALMLRESIQRWIASLVTGEVTLRLRRGEDYTSCAPTARRSPTTPTSCRWSAPRTPPSARPTGSASSPCATSTSPTRAPSSSCTPRQPLDQGQVLVEHGTLFGELEAGRRRPDRRATRPPRATRATRRSTTPPWSSAPTDGATPDGDHQRPASSGAAGSPAARRPSSTRCRARPTSTGG